jgi:AraC-like DNA-binding protein
MREILLANLHESAVTDGDFPALADAGIAIIGFTRVTEACHRKPQPDDRSHAHLHITLRGCATARIDGRMTQIPANHAYIVPPECAAWEWRTEASGEEPWEVVFVRLSAGFKAPGVHFKDRPCIQADCDPHDLLWAFQRLHREALQTGRAAIISNLVNMVAYHVAEVLCPDHKPSALIELWTKVAANLEMPWHLDDLSRHAGMCKETLRQSCLRETGRSPVQHVAHLRMRHAATLLQSGLYRVEDVARLVGYENPFNFSTAFKRTFGTSPSNHRRPSQPRT